MKTAAMHNGKTHTAHEKTPAPDLALGPGRRVLVVEDNVTAGKQLKQLLEVDPDLTVDIASDGTQDPQALTKQTYAIVVTDLRIPRLDGMQLNKEGQKRRTPGREHGAAGHR